MIICHFSNYISAGINAFASRDLMIWTLVFMRIYDFGGTVQLFLAAFLSDYFVLRISAGIVQALDCDLSFCAGLDLGLKGSKINQEKKA